MTSISRDITGKALEVYIDSYLLRLVLALQMKRYAKSSSGIKLGVNLTPESDIIKSLVPHTTGRMFSEDAEPLKPTTTLEQLIRGISTDREALKGMGATDPDIISQLSLNKTLSKMGCAMVFLSRVMQCQENFSLLKGYLDEFITAIKDFPPKFELLISMIFINQTKLKDQAQLKQVEELIMRYGELAGDPQGTEFLKDLLPKKKIAAGKIKAGNMVKKIKVLNAFKLP